MNKKTIWISAIAAGAVLVLGGAGIALAATELLDDRFSGTSQSDNRGDDHSDNMDDRDDRDRSDTGTDDRMRDDTDDDRPLSDDERTRAKDAALAEVGDGTITDLDRSDDADHAFEVEVLFADGRDVEVELDENFRVVRVDLDD